MDDFAGHTSTLDAPVRSATPVAPSDATDLSRVTRAIYVGQSGDVRVRMAEGMTATFASVPAGSILPIRTDRVLQTGTTAGNLLALW